MARSNDEYSIESLPGSSSVSWPAADKTDVSLTGEKAAADPFVRQDLLSSDDISRSLAAQAQINWIDISDMIVPPEIIEEMRPQDARRFKVIPIARNEHGLVVATGDPLDVESIDGLSFLLKRPIEVVCTSPEKLRQALIKYYGNVEEAVDVLREKIGAAALQELDLEKAVELSESESGDAPIIRLISLLLIEAHRLGASDIHLEPLEKRFRVRFRIDGVLHEMNSPPKKLQSAIINRLKIMSGSMSIAERRLPQDARIQVKIAQQAVDLRVSTIPTNHGESMVLRVLDKATLLRGLPELGFLSDDQETFERILRAPEGMILVTGPTGSGKTTTLYACLSSINKPDRKIITLEEPVEYQLTGINQVQVNGEIGMTFATALRSILRQAPNVIMIGEIRDLETASIATNASLTGHLVFSTLHTNDAPSTITRLIDIGVPPFLVASAIRAIMAQRLVRRLCVHCKNSGRLSESELRGLNIEPSQLPEGVNLMRAMGCERCRGTGYKGRLGIFEIFQIDDEVQHLISARASDRLVRQRARQLGMRTLREDGVRKVLAGLTTAEEVISMTIADGN